MGCEGESEQGYIRLIGHIADQLGLYLHFDAQLCNGGDHLAVVETAVGLMKSRSKKHGAYWRRAVFLDSDRRKEQLHRTNRADQLIAQNNFIPVWSDPCLEGLLLRHLPETMNLRPQTAGRALGLLAKTWPEYDKPMPAQHLQSKIDLPAIRRAAGTHNDLHRFLAAVGI